MCLSGNIHIVYLRERAQAETVSQHVWEVKQVKVNGQFDCHVILKMYRHRKSSA